MLISTNAVGMAQWYGVVLWQIPPSYRRFVTEHPDCQTSHYG